MPGGAVDAPQPLGLGWRDLAAGEQVGEPDDGVHGRADLVAHVGQEGALGPVGRLRPGAGTGELQGAALHQLLQVVAVAVQLVGHALLLGDVLLDRDIVGDRPIGLTQRGDDGVFGIFAAVTPPVDELALPGMGLAQGLPECAVGGRRGLAGLKDARILADGLGPRVTGGPHEGLVDILDLPRQIGDDDTLRALLHRLGELAQLHLVAALAHDAPHLVGQELDGLHVQVGIGFGLVAHRGDHAHQAGFEHRHADQAHQGRVAGGQSRAPNFILGGGDSVVADDRGALAQGLGPDACVSAGVRPIVGRPAIVFQGVPGPGGHLDGLLIVVDEVGEADAAAGELLGQRQRVLHEGGFSEALGGPRQVQQGGGAARLEGQGLLRLTAIGDVQEAAEDPYHPAVTHLGRRAGAHPAALPVGGIQSQIQVIGLAELNRALKGCGQPGAVFRGIEAEDALGVGRVVVLGDPEDAVDLCRPVPLTVRHVILPAAEPGHFLGMPQQCLLLEQRGLPLLTTHPGGHQGGQEQGGHRVDPEYPQTDPL